MRESQDWEAFFEKIYLQFYASLCVFAKSFVYDDDEAEEIVQSIILKLWEHKESTAEITSLKSYLYRAVRNTCLNHIKHEKIKNQYQDTSWIKLKEIESEFIDPYQNTELEEHINEAIFNLPERCREVFEMSRFDGLKNKEISEKLDISVKAVEANITRALATLRKKINNYIHSEDNI
jgi:RNA polymerase sigma-70 factor (ECF subfamily)